VTEPIELNVKILGREEGMRALRLVAFERGDEINAEQHIRWGVAVFISQKQSTVNRHYATVPLGWREVLGRIP
jgi:hypothetical protein